MAKKSGNRIRPQDRFPQRELPGRAEEWGRTVENRIKALEKEAIQRTQKTDNLQRVMVPGHIVANRVTADAIDGMTITGATVRTQESGQRVQLDPQGVRGFDENEVELFKLSSEASGATFDFPSGTHLNIASTGLDDVHVFGETTEDRDAVKYQNFQVGSQTFLAGGAYAYRTGLDFRVGADSSDDSLSLQISRGPAPFVQGTEALLTSSAPLTVSSDASEGVSVTSRFSTPGNVFPTKALLDGWLAIDGSIAYVTADNSHYVRRNGAWLPLAAGIKIVEGFIPYTAQIAPNGGTDINVTFPAGAFTSPPRVYLQAENGARLSVTPRYIDQGGFQCRIYNFTGSNANGHSGVQWMATGV